MPASSPEGKVFQLFADLVKQKSNSKMVIHVFPSEQLGKTQAVLEQLQAGLGTVEIKAMSERGYERPFSAAITADYSSGYFKRTIAALPAAAAFTNVARSNIRANWTANGNPADTEYWCENTTTGGVSGWTTALNWDSTGLTCNSSYAFRVKARNAEEVETGWRSLGSQSTLTCAEICEGDFEPDGDVDDTDLSAFTADFGRIDCSGATDCPGDFEPDSDVDGSNLAIFAADFRRTNCL